MENMENMEDIEEVEEIEEIEEIEKLGYEEKVYLENQGYPSFLYGRFGRRFLAFIIDIIVISAIYNIISISSINILGADFLVPFEKIIYSLIYVLYFSLITKVTNGQTMGKILFDLRVVCPTEEKLSWSTVITREILSRYILKKIVILYISVPFTKTNRHIGDFFSNTYVIREDYVYEYSTMMETLSC